MQKYQTLAAVATALVLSLACADHVRAVMSGPCSGCHTMHNSQNNLPMRYDNGAQPLPQLLRGDCYGCHAQGLPNALVSVGIDVIPQVYHTEGGDLTTDLAGGNFAYINGAKGGAAADSKGHNISDLWTVGTDGVLYEPPGGIVQSFHDNGGNVNTDNLGCAGTNGCHGNRYYDIDGYTGISGAHHNNVNGQVIQGAGDREPGHGYRFLLGVNGYEDPDWQYTRSDVDHNEYYGRSAPIQLGCGGGAGVVGCHAYGGVRPPNGTMAEYCASCHGNFHTLATSSSNGVGTVASSPFIRHPSDLAISNSPDFATFITYRPDTPVARTTTAELAAPDGGVTGTDAVFCLSCHVAHGSPYPDMLKWDYATMDVGNAGGTGAAGKGCFACHSSKE
ncbi:MAG: hypothetical protein C4563_10790 [Desulfobulbus sp.]|nr:MAG: hypothetical protein C4563_10790 [Desulfobulbus sp.]